MKTKTLYTHAVLILLQCLFVTLLLAQTRPVKQWDKRFGGSDQEDKITRVIQTSDGGYLIGGSSASNKSGDKSQNRKTQTFGSYDYDYWIVKTDGNGVKQWDSTYGGQDHQDYLTCFQQTSDRGYILGGYSYSQHGNDKSQDSRGSFDYWVVKINANGTKQWDKRFGGINSDELYSIQQTTDGGYILGGDSYSNSGPNTDKSQDNWGAADYWIVKINSVGGWEWDKTFGGSSTDFLRSVVQTTDGGYILGGYSASTSNIDGGKTEDSDTQGDFWVVKTDANGVKQWDKIYRPQGAGYSEYFYSIHQALDGGYILGGVLIGLDNHYEYCLIKTRQDGQQEWFRQIGGLSHDWLQDVQQTTDGGYILGGRSNSSIGKDKTQNNWNGSFDYWIVKINESGTTQEWDATFGGYGDDFLYSVQQTTDGGFILGGVSSSDSNGDKTQDNWKDGNGNTTWDYWIVKTQPACSNPQKFYQDFDGDGYGNPSDTIRACSQPSGYVMNNLDCKDSIASIHPGAVEICGNSIDDNCNGQIDEGCSTCKNATGLTTTNITSNSAKLNWTASVNPAQWQVQYKKAIAGATWTNIKLAGSARSVNIPSLTANQKYQWHIRIKCGTTWTTYSALINFKTLSPSVQQPSSLESAAIEKSLSPLMLYPNPSKGNITVTHNSGIAGRTEIKVYDMMGRIVFNKTEQAIKGSNTYHLNLFNLIQGIYFLELNSGGQQNKMKLIIEK